MDRGGWWASRSQRAGHNLVTKQQQLQVNFVLGHRACRGRAPVDPGNSKPGRLWRGKLIYLLI